MEKIIMKKIFAIFTSLSLIFLLGCSAKKEQVHEKINIEDTTKEQEQEREQEQKQEEEQEKVKEKENVEEITDTESINTKEYEEISKIAKKLMYKIIIWMLNQIIKEQELFYLRKMKKRCINLCL